MTTAADKPEWADKIPCFYRGHPVDYGNPAEATIPCPYRCKRYLPVVFSGEKCQIVECECGGSFLVKWQIIHDIFKLERA